MVPTQVSRLAQGLGRMGYPLALGAVLMLGAVLGLGLAVARQGSVDLSWALVAMPVFLLVCTPLVAFGALRAFAEQESLAVQALRLHARPCIVCSDNDEGFAVVEM